MQQIGSLDFGFRKGAVVAQDFGLALGGHPGCRGHGPSFPIQHHYRRFQLGGIGQGGGLSEGALRQELPMPPEGRRHDPLLQLGNRGFRIG